MSVGSDTEIEFPLKVAFGSEIVCALESLRAILFTGLPARFTNFSLKVIFICLGAIVSTALFDGVEATSAVCALATGIESKPKIKEKAKILLNMVID